MVRSPHRQTANAAVSAILFAAVRAMPPACALVLAGADASGLEDPPASGPARNSDGSKMPLPPYPIIARDQVRHVGDVVGVVVAERWPRPARRPKPSRPSTKPPRRGPSGIGRRAGRGRAAGLAGARHQPRLRRLRGRCGRDRGRLREGRAHGLAHPRQQTASWRTSSSRAPASPRSRPERIASPCAGQPGQPRRARPPSSRGSSAGRRGRLRVVTPDVGGGFGTKIFTYRGVPALRAGRRRSSASP